MGLDAAVYCQPNEHDPSQNIEIPVIHRRLGNASLIGWISQEVIPLVGTDSILFRKVLFSGSHSGDCIELDELETLESEISCVKSNQGNSLEVDRFLSDLNDLIIAARKHSAPILFE